MESRVRAIVVSVSDSRDESNDVSGDLLRDLVLEAGFTVIEKVIVTDNFEDLRQTLYSYTETEANLILTTGGTGFAPRDNTPEATLAVIEKETPGISEALRSESSRHTKFAMISRGVSGIRNSTLIINFPGSVKGVEQCFDIVKGVLEHSIRLIEGDTGH